MKNIFLKPGIPLTIFFVVFLLFIVSLYQRAPNEDEAVIAGHSYFLNKLGYPKSDLYGGYLEGKDAWENRQYFYHKLFVLTGTVFMKFFGFNIYSFKVISLFFMIIFFIVLYLYLKRYFSPFSLPFYLLTCSLLLFNNHFFDQSFMFRPEIMVMALGFISFYFLQKGLSGNKYYLIYLSGMFSGLAAFTHLNGIIYSFAGLLFLIIKKEFKKAIGFSVIAGLFSLLYFFDIHSYQDFQSLIHQLKTDPNVVDKVPFYMGLLNEQMRFLHSPVEIVFTLLLTFALVFNFSYLKMHCKSVMLYLLILVIGLGMLSHGKTAKYGLNYFPYIAIIIVAGYSNISQLKLGLRVLGFFLIAVFISVHGLNNLQLIMNHVDISKHNAELSSYIPEKYVKISAPSVFVFNEMENYTIRGEIAWDHHYYVFHPKEKRGLDNYFYFAGQNGDKYILIDKATNGRKDILSIFERNLNVNDLIFNFKVISRSNDFILLKNAGL